MHARSLIIAASFLFGAGLSAAQAQTQTYLPGFNKTNNIYTALNQQFPTTGTGTPGSGTGTPNAQFLFDPATYTSPNAVAGANRTTNGVIFQLASDSAGHDFAEVGGTSSVSVACNIFGATSVSALLNSYSYSNVNVTFTGSGGASETFGSVGLYDFNAQGGPINNSYNFNGSAAPNLLVQTAFQVNDQGGGGSGNSSTGDFATYGLDEYTFTLDPAFADQTLQSITFQNNNTSNSTLVFGVTATSPSVSNPVPEASTTVSLGLLLALGALGCGVRARRKAAQAPV